MVFANFNFFLSCVEFHLRGQRERIILSTKHTSKFSILLLRAHDSKYCWCPILQVQILISLFLSYCLHFRILLHFWVQLKTWNWILDKVWGRKRSINSSGESRPGESSRRERETENPSEFIICSNSSRVASQNLV